MSKAARITLVIISLALFLGIPALAGLRIWDASNSGIQSADRHFARVVATVEQASEYIEDQDFQSFARELRPVVRSANNLAVLVVARADNSVDYAWSRRASRIQGAWDAIEFEPKIPRIDPWERQLDTRLPIRNREELVVAAVYETLEQAMVYRTLRDALLTILAFVLLMLIVLISTLRSAGNGYATTAAEPGVESAARAQPAATPAGRRDSTAGSDTRAGVHRGKTTDEPMKGTAGKGAGGSTGEQNAPFEQWEGDTETVEAASGSMSESSSSTPPLVSPTSGLSFESHLPRRLSLELERSAENNLDLSLLVIRITDADGTPVGTKLLGRLVLEQFPFEDLAFEYSPAGACVILTGIDLDTALRKAERLQALLRRHELGSYRVRVGASSRNGRLVESERLVNEATEAFRRTDSESIAVGFRPDPDRYRSYIASRVDGTR